MIYLTFDELGFDEVGRGCIAGPITVGCVALTPESCNYLEKIGVKDSKMIKKTKSSNPYKSRKKMNYLAEEIKDASLDYGIGCASPKEIDTFGLNLATKLALKRACSQISIPINKYCIDGYPIFDIEDKKSQFYKKGDTYILQIACASIIAKDYRDRFMINLSQNFDMYNFQNNVGYGTKDHIEAIKKYGIIPEHRKSTRTIKRINHDSNKNQV